MSSERSTGPILWCVIAAVFFREHLGARTWIAVALIVAASVLLWAGVPQGGLAAVLVGLACVAWGLVEHEHAHRPDLHHRHPHAAANSD